MEFDPHNDRLNLDRNEARLLGFPENIEYVPVEAASDLIDRVANATHYNRELIVNRSLDGFRSESAYRRADRSLQMLSRMSSVLLEHVTSPTDGAEQLLELEDMFRQK